MFQLIVSSLFYVSHVCWEKCWIFSFHLRYPWHNSFWILHFSFEFISMFEFDRWQPSYLIHKVIFLMIRHVEVLLKKNPIHHHRFFSFPFLMSIGLCLLCICDAIKQNESELEYNENPVFNCIICPIVRAIFWWNPHQNWIKKASSDSFCLITSHILILQNISN